ncbi:MAG: methyltransferase domain-containing protein [archaeon]
MGDYNRFRAMAAYICDHFTPPMRVADVGGGKGHLNEILTAEGFAAVTIDPSFDCPELAGIPARYSAGMACEYDLIVGLHPDGATQEIVHSARTRPVVIVPCCNVWDGSVSPRARSINYTIQRFFWANGIPWERDELPISGKNRVYRTSVPE